MIGDVYQRSGHQAQVDELTEADLEGPRPDFSNAEDEDLPADAEDNGTVRQKEIVLVDPGPFRYNRKVCLAAIPCFLLVLAICGEM